jgi:NAD(P)-dependent dehydrogenase (short-subunit alcohol dehydrogenase family)
MRTAAERFDLSGRVAVITGGAGLLGVQHAEAIASAGGTPGIADIAGDDAERVAARLAHTFGIPAFAVQTDTTKPEQVQTLLETVLARYGRVDILINNAASNPTVETNVRPDWARVEHFSLQQWNDDLAVGLTGAFLCSQIIGGEMARRGSGVILNIASDLAMVAPDQRIYRRDDLGEDEQPVKPVSYSVVKTALLGLTRYLATYWADRGVRVNALSPGGVYDEQPMDFVAKLTDRIPMGRMAHPDEYQAAIVFLCSDASSYMTGANLVMDGGRTAW